MDHMNTKRYVIYNYDKLTATSIIYVLIVRQVLCFKEEETFLTQVKTTCYFFFDTSKNNLSFILSMLFAGKFDRNCI